MGYVNSAKAWLQTKLSLACSDINQNQGMIADVLHEATKWRKPKPKREPYTYKMFEQLHRRIEKQRGKAAAALWVTEERMRHSGRSRCVRGRLPFNICFLLSPAQRYPRANDQFSDLLAVWRT